jgi:hypothetical protein
MLFGKLSFLVSIDPARDGSEIVNAAADHILAEFLPWIGLNNLPPPTPRVNDN